MATKKVLITKYPAYHVSLNNKGLNDIGEHIGFVELTLDELGKIDYGESGYYFRGVSRTNLKTGVKEEIIVKVKVSSENEKYDQWRYCDDNESNIIHNGMLYEYNPSVLSGHQPPFRLYVRRDEQKNMVVHLNKFYEDHQINNIMEKHMTLLHMDGYSKSVKDFEHIFHSVNTNDLFYRIEDDEMKFFKFESMSEDRNKLIISYWDEANNSFAKPTTEHKEQCFRSFGCQTEHVGRVFL